jgi:phage virion morphogenesis protein
MSGVSLTVDDTQVTQALGRLQRATTNLRDPMAAIGQTLVDNIALGFRGQTDPWGNAWTPLSAVTRARRRGSSYQILRDTGILANSFNYQADASSVTVGTAVEYAGTHQFGARKGAYGRTRRGGPIPWGDIPARPMLPIRGNRADVPADWQDEILFILARHLDPSA